MGSLDLSEIRMLFLWLQGLHNVEENNNLLSSPLGMRYPNDLHESWKDRIFSEAREANLPSDLLEPDPRTEEDTELSLYGYKNNPTCTATKTLVFMLTKGGKKSDICQESISEVADSCTCRILKKGQ